MYKYGNIEDAKPGDVLERIKKGSSNEPYDQIGYLAVVGNDYPEAEGVKPSLDPNWWKLVKTKPGSEAKVGDTVIRFKDGTRTCPTGTVFTVLEIDQGYLYYTSVLAAETDECKVLCKTSTTKSEPDTPRVAIVTKHVSGHPVGSRIVLTDASNDTWELADGPNSFIYCHSIGSNCEWEDELTTCTDTATFTSLGETSPATPCSQPTLNPIPEEDTMNDLNKKNISISMTADEYAKYQKSNKPTKPKSQLETAPKWFTIWYGVNGNVDCQTTESPKKAKKALQHPSKLGFTFRSYLIAESATTNIPVVNVEI